MFDIHVDHHPVLCIVCLRLGGVYNAPPTQIPPSASLMAFVCIPGSMRSPRDHRGRPDRPPARPGPRPGPGMAGLKAR
jgi:hypothetical protein